jgi:hypothetical protein
MIELRLLAVVCVGVALPSSEGSFFGLSMPSDCDWGLFPYGLRVGMGGTVVGISLSVSFYECV